jgi:hypothetical protein
MPAASPWLPDLTLSTWIVLGAILALAVLVRFLRGLENEEKTAAFFRSTVLRRPWVSVALALAVVGGLAAFLPRFSLEASSESLVLENDPDLVAYNRTRMVYGSDEYVIVSFRREGMFAPESIAFIDGLTKDLQKVEGVSQVLSITNIPLYRMTGLTAIVMGQKPLTLTSPNIDLARAKEDIVSSPVWSVNLISPDATTTSVIVYFRIPPENIEAERELFVLKDRMAAGGDVKALEREYREKKAAFTVLEDARKAQRRRTLADVRAALRARPEQRFYASGIPLIVIDMVDYIRGDMTTFCAGVTVFLVVLLALLFRRWRWVVFPLFICAATVVSILGMMAALGKRVTVITSNTASILFIVAMAHSVHFINKYREDVAHHPKRPFRDRLAAVAGALWIPCFYTALTDAGGFGSTGICDIRPVIEFAVFMTIGVMLALVLTFVFMPAGLALLPEPAEPGHREGRLRFMRRLAGFTLRHRWGLVFATLVVCILSAVGVGRLEVETRFNDYFRQDTDIAQGLKFIDSEMGGTSTLEVVLDGGNPDYFTKRSNLDKLGKVQKYLETVPEVGKVLTVNDLLEEGRRAVEGDGTKTKTGRKVTRVFAAARPALAFIAPVAWEAGARALAARAEATRLTPVIEMLRKQVDPATVAGYISRDWSQSRVFVRMRESAPTLQRRRVITGLQDWLRSQPDLADAKPVVTGIFLLYTNMLDSLMQSQIGTFWVSFVAIGLMMWALFHSWRLAVMGLFLNLIPILLVLGAMGWAGIHLDMMTILIASVALGIAVDGTTHYAWRYQEELQSEKGRVRAVYRTHVSIGRAIFYTAIIILFGFWVLMLSNFKPTLWFGFFTGLAMIGALFGALTLMPLMLLAFRPVKPKQRTTKGE